MFIPDERFQSIFTEATDTWTLQVKYVQTRDEGEYECQISTDPKKSHIIKLNIVGESIDRNDPTQITPRARSYEQGELLISFNDHILQCQRSR